MDKGEGKGQQMGRLNGLIELAVVLWDAARSLDARDVYAGVVALAGMVVVGELVLAMF